jgi:hypothetical protein
MSASRLVHLHDVPVLVCPPDGPVLRTDQDALDLIAEGIGRGAAQVAVPVARLADEFFALRTGVAGAITQKFANYRLRLAVVGDVSRHLAGSAALRDFVGEANRGRQLWFVADLADLARRLAARPPAAGRGQAGDALPSAGTTDRPRSDHHR